MLGLTPAGFYTTKELADCLKLTPRTVQRWIDAGQLPAYRFGRKYRVRGDAFEAFLDTYKAHHSKQPVTDTVTDASPAAKIPRCVAATIPEAEPVTDTVTDTDAAPPAKRKASARQRAVTDTITDTEALQPPAPNARRRKRLPVAY